MRQKRCRYRPLELRPLTGQKLYDLQGVNIYKLTRELVGHLSDPKVPKNILDKATDRLFPTY
jgi:hypothetical protein